MLGRQENCVILLPFVHKINFVAQLLYAYDAHNNIRDSNIVNSCIGIDDDDDDELYRCVQSKIIGRRTKLCGVGMWDSTWNAQTLSMVMRKRWDLTEKTKFMPIIVRCCYYIMYDDQRINIKKVWIHNLIRITSCSFLIMCRYAYNYLVINSNRHKLKVQLFILHNIISWIAWKMFKSL